MANGPSAKHQLPGGSDAAADFTIVQAIWTRWTKKSRDAPASAVRNAVPESVSLPVNNQTRMDGMLWHEVVFDEAFAFVPREVVRTYPMGNRNFNAAEIIPQSNALTILWQGGTQRLELPAGSYGRLVFNYCAEEVDDGWYYRIYNKVCMNAIMGSTVQPGLFQQTSPHRELRCLTALP